MSPALRYLARGAVRAARLLRPGARWIQFGAYAAPGKLTRTQELFVQWRAECLGISAEESRARFVASWQSLPRGHFGADYREFCVLSHELFRPFHSDAPAEVFASYRFHAPLHFLRFLSYGHGNLVDAPIEEDLASRKDVGIVDYGCGLAQGSIDLAERLQAKGVRVRLALVDIPTVMTEFLKWMTAKLGLSAEFIDCDERQPYPAFPPCHLCIANEVFEHIHEPLKAFENVDAALQPGGYLYAEISDHTVEFFHVSPSLGELRARLRDRGYAKVGATVYRKEGRR